MDDNSIARQTDGSWSRRSLLRLISTLAATGALGTLARGADGRPTVDDAMLRQAEWLSGLRLDESERKLMLAGVNEMVGEFEALRAIDLDNAVAPALILDLGVDPLPVAERPLRVIDDAPGRRPPSALDVAFAPVTRLRSWLRAGELTSTELTRIYLERLGRLDEQLLCVIETTTELALEQADRADRELSRGLDRGPLHGIPWGAKDLLSVPGYRTTWGARPFERQRRDERATAASRLDDAGAVLLAKLTLGALAWGDVWYGGMTRNPWNLEQGSSGSSAGPASATSAGLVGFSIGSETWGSIVSPCTRCGTTGLRPTFGAVSRHGAMALSFSMDKLGPIARSVEDCALVFDAIRGGDGLDRSVTDRPFAWPLDRDVRSLRVGYVEAAFDEARLGAIDDEAQREAAREWLEIDRSTLQVLRDLGVTLQPIALPQRYPVTALSFILSAEAAAAFDDLTRSGRDARLVRQVEQAWPNVFRQAQLIPAVEYIRANRVRTLIMQQMQQVMADIDVYVCPSFGANNLLLTNLTGHPCVVLPNGFRADGTPTSITFNGRLHGETELLALAHSFQQATDFHLRRPPMATRS